MEYYGAVTQKVLNGESDSTFATKDAAFATAQPFKPFTERRKFFANAGERKRLNINAVLVSLFGPWLLFCFMYGILSFSLHYFQPYIAYALATLAFIGGVCLPGVLSANALKRKATDPTYQPSWYLFLFATCLLAFIVGSSFGEENYTEWMYKYYSLEHLSEYTDVDTNLYLGQQLMDAGRINYKHGTRVNVSRSMGFKNNEMYCVAPIMSANSPNKPQSYDFWAVGKNCCSGHSADFHCPGFNDRLATGSIRLMHDDERPFYRLAVQQAEATYKMTATHPLFFEWVHDADEAVNAFAQKGFTNYLGSICTYFLFQIFLVVCTTLLFSKLMHYPADSRPVAYHY